MGNKSVLIAGGTSGLGRELALLFLKNGFMVAVTGRQSFIVPGYEDRYKLFRVDFSDLAQTSESVKQICSTYEFDIVVNSAGILSPPDYTLTKDGNEYTFQVNYLAHLMINEIIIRKQSGRKPLRICAITSPVYRIAGKIADNINIREGYNPLKAYSASKLLLAMMCKEFSSKYPESDLVSFSFNPGVFSSGIYRMQGRIFRILYHIAAPFMKSPVHVAKSLFNILTDSKLTDGVIYNMRNKTRSLPDFKYPENESFRKVCFDKINPFLG